MAQPAPSVPPGLGSADEASFAREAARTGLNLPRPHPLRVGRAVALIVVIVVAAAGIGDLTGWAVGPIHEGNSLDLYGAEDCSAAIAPVTVNLTGTDASGAGAPWSVAIQGLGGVFSQWTGGCVNVSVAPSTGDGYAPTLADHAVDFAVAPLPPDASDQSALGNASATVPGALVAVEIVYDLPGLPAPLRLNASVVAGLYGGEITAWDNPALAALNPGVDLSSLPSVTPIFREGSAAVNLAFTTYLSDGSVAWAGTVGAGQSVTWPEGVGVQNASAMAAVIAATPGAIGYVESIDPTPLNATVAALATPNGTFVQPSATSVGAAATAVDHSVPVTSRDWANLSIVDAPGTTSYPLVEVVYVTVYVNLGTAYGGALSFTNATWLVSFLWWLVGNASASIVALGLTPVPANFENVGHNILEKELYNSIVIAGDNESAEGGGETGEF